MIAEQLWNTAFWQTAKQLSAVLWQMYIRCIVQQICKLFRIYPTQRVKKKILSRKEFTVMTWSEKKWNQKKFFNFFFNFERVSISNCIFFSFHFFNRIYVVPYSWGKINLWLTSVLRKKNSLFYPVFWGHFDIWPNKNDDSFSLQVTELPKRK